MFLPFGTDRPLRRPTRVNHALLALNIGAFLALAVLERMDPQMAGRVMEALALHPMRPAPWALASYAFLHAGLAHLLGNMLFLWVFGPNVEDRLGRVGYAAFYLLGAVGAGALHATFESAPVVGASGAIAAVTGAYLVLFPHTVIRTLVIFFFIGIFQIPALWFIGARIFWDLALQASGAGGRIATLAHLGGYGYGIAVAMALLATKVLSREPYDLFSISRRAARRGQFRDAARQRELAMRRVESQDRPDPKAEAIMLARADVAASMADHDLPAAARKYHRLLDLHGAGPRVALLSRRHQYELANYLFETGDHQTAATAYELFLAGYGRDPEAPVVRLMLGLINADHLNDPVRAKHALAAALEDLPEGEHRKLAKRILADLA